MRKRLDLLPLVLPLLSLISLKAASSPEVTPERKGGEVILFDAGEHGPKGLRHYTARWRKGSDLVPICRGVQNGDRRAVEISYTGQQGMACSTLFPARLPEPAEDKRYAGIRLAIEYDEVDYAKLSVTIGYRDKTLLSSRLTLEKGRHKYDVVRGYRRAQSPPDWTQIAHIMLTSHAADRGMDYDGRNLRFRLLRITMIESPVPKGSGTLAPDGTGRGQNLFGKRLFSPRPKKVMWRKGKAFLIQDDVIFVPRDASKRTKRTAGLFGEQLTGYTGHQLRLQTFGKELPPQGIVLRLLGSARFGGETVSLAREGYALTVGKDRIVITGCDEPGLYYGTVTLLQMVKQPMRIRDRVLVPGVEILDWPDTPIRLCRLEHIHHFRNCEVKEKRGIEYLMDWVDRFVTGNKLNLFYLDMSAVQYERRPEFNGREKLYSLDDLRKLGVFCRDRFVEVCPAWQVGGHATWWLTVGYHPELAEKGWRSQADVTHPDHDAIVFDCMLDVIEALRPKYLSPKSDEWWHTRKENEEIEERLRGKTRPQAFLDFHLKLHAWLKQRGITMAMYHDMLTPYHNGKRFDTYTITDALPRDIVILVWNSGHPKMIRFFSDRGFRVWANPTGMFFPGEEDRHRIEGYGKGIYSWGQYHHGLMDSYNPLTSHFDHFRAADFAWNMKRDRGESTLTQIESGRLGALRNMFAVRPNPSAGERIEPIDIRAAMTHSFGAYLKQVKPAHYPPGQTAPEIPNGVQELGFIPMRLAGTGKRNCIVVREGDPEVGFPVGGRFSSLIFLHAAFIDKPDDERARGVAFRRWPYGWPLGDYIVHYQGGGKGVLPLRLPMNIKRFDTSFQNRATLENRYVHSLKAGGADDIHFFQWEWVNPRPHDVIEKITARHAGELGVSLILLAVSGRWVKTGVERRS